MPGVVHVGWVQQVGGSIQDKKGVGMDMGRKWDIVEGLQERVEGGKHMDMLEE